MSTVGSSGSFMMVSLELEQLSSSFVTSKASCVADNGWISLKLRTDLRWTVTRNTQAIDGRLILLRNSSAMCIIHELAARNRKQWELVVQCYGLVKARLSWLGISEVVPMLENEGPELVWCVLQRCFMLEWDDCPMPQGFQCFPNVDRFIFPFRLKSSQPHINDGFCCWFMCYQSRSVPIVISLCFFISFADFVT